MESRRTVQNREVNTEQEIDLLEIASVIWRKFWIVLIGLLIGAFAAFAFTKILITPQYKATSTIYIFSKTTSITSLADLQIGSQLTEDFQIIATTRDVVENVIAEAQLDETYEELVKKISVTNPKDSHMLLVTVTDPDPEQAAALSNILADKLREQIADIMNTDKPSTVERAVVPVKPASPSTRKNVLIGSLIGAAIVVAVIILKYLTDDTIKNGDDVQKYLGLNTLAEFPFIKGQSKGKKSSRRKPAKRGKSSR